MSVGDKALSGASWVAVSNWGSRVMATVVLVVLARLLSPEDFGLVAFASVFVAGLAIVRDVGFVQAIVQKAELEDEHLHSAFWASLVLGLALTATVLFAAPAVAAAVDEPELTPVLRALSLSFAIGGVRSVSTALLTRDMRFQSLAVRSLAGDLVGGSLGVAWAVGGGGVWSLVVMALANSIVEAIVVVSAARYRPQPVVSTRHLRDLFNFSAGVLGLQVMNFVFRRSDDVLVGAVLGSAALGLYSVGYRLVSLVRELFVQTVTQVTLPAFSKLQADHRRLQSAAASAVHGLVLAALPALVGMALCAPEAVAVVFGEDWDAAAPIMRLLAIGAVADPVVGLQTQLLLAQGLSRRAFLIGVINGGVGLVGFALAVQHGATWVAAAFAIRGLVMLPVSFVVVGARGLSLRTFATSASRPALAAALMGAAVIVTRVLLSDSSDETRLAVSVAMGVLSYSAALYATDPVARDLFKRGRQLAIRRRS